MDFSKDGNFHDREDEISIAMFAFYEALMNYDRKKGAFFAMAKTYIRNRLIDFWRKEGESGNTLSLDEEVHDDGKATVLDTIEDEKSSVEYSETRECTKEEIEDFAAALSLYGLTLTDIADNAPRQERTMEACLASLEYARRNPELLRIFEEKKKIPMSRLVKEGGFDRKTLERHRKYLVGIFLAFTNGFVIIRDHLRAMKGAEL